MGVTVMADLDQATTGELFAMLTRSPADRTVIRDELAARGYSAQIVPAADLTDSERDLILDELAQ
jgi:hypothetical protein